MNFFSPKKPPATAESTEPNPDYNPFDAQDPEAGQVEPQPEKKSKKKKGESKSKTEDSAEGSLSKKEQELARKEAELAQREAQLEQRVSQVIKLGGEDNWPSRCYPIAYHDISKEIPERRRTLIRKLYVVVIFTWICLFWNWMIMLSVWFAGGDVSASSEALWSSLYMVLGIPLSWRWWYRGAYYACRDRSSKQWVSFFIGFGLHFVLCILLGVGIPNFGGAGLLWMIKLFSNSYQICGVLSIICTAFWGVNWLASSYLLKESYAAWKQGGGSDQLTRDVTKAAIDSELRAVRETD